MKLRFLKHPTTGTPDALMTMSCIVTAICAVKFLFEGMGHNLGHADAASYAAMLAPVLGAHGASEYKRVSKERDGSAAVDNPDGN